MNTVRTVWHLSREEWFIPYYRRDAADIKRNIYFFRLIILILLLVVGGTACMENPDKYSTSNSQSWETSRPDDVVEKSDRQIVEAIFNEWYPSLKKDEVASWADEAMEIVMELSGKLFGRIISEEDAMEKAQAVWIKLGWLDDIKDKKTYKAEFYNEYGVWMVDSFYQQYDNDSPSPYDVVPGSGYCTIMRKSDGKVLAAWVS